MPTLLLAILLLFCTSASALSPKETDNNFKRAYEGRYEVPEDTSCLKIRLTLKGWVIATVDPLTGSTDWINYQDRRRLKDRGAVVGLSLNMTF